MLQYAPQRRITAEAALEHAFFDDLPSSDNIAQIMKKMNSKPAKPAPTHPTTSTANDKPIDYMEEAPPRKRR